MLLAPSIINLAIALWNHKFHLDKTIMIQNVLIGVAISAIIALLIFRGWYHMFNIQRLCEMSFDAVYYNLEGEQIEGKIVSGKKDMTYFPKIYYRYKKRKMNVSIRLDGSKFHEQFTSMADRFGEMFDMEVTSAKRKYWYMVYTLEYIEEDRLHLGKTDIKSNRNEIPLMKSLIWNFKNAPHALITGVTGGGKSYFLYYLIQRLKSMGAIIKIIDPKRSDLFGLRHILGIENVAYAVGKVMKMFREIVTEMDERYKKLDDTNIPFGSDYETLGLKPVFILFDEFVAFIESLEKAEDKQRLMSYLTRIVLEGRQAGIFLVFATQRADAKYLSGAIRDNLGLRVSLGGLEKSGYRMTFGDVDKRFEKFDKGHGYVWVNGVTDTVREYYSPFLGMDYDPVKELERIVNQQADTPVELRSSSNGSEKGEDACLSEDEVRARENLPPGI